MRLLPTQEEITAEGIKEYETMQRTKGWQFHQSVLQLYRGRMLEVLLSKNFTEKSAQEKDVTQRTFHELDKIISFLLNPLAIFKQSNKWKLHNDTINLKLLTKERINND